MADVLGKSLRVATDATITIITLFLQFISFSVGQIDCLVAAMTLLRLPV